jgi:hypothetical protein
MNSSRAVVSIAGDDLWNRLFAACVNQVPFSTGNWRRAVCSISDLYCDPVILSHNDDVLAGINIYYQKKGSLRFCRHPRLTPYNTVLLSESFTALDAAVQQSLWQQLLQYLRKNYIYPYFLTDTYLTDALLFRQNAFNVRQGHTYIVDPAVAVPESDIRRRARKCMESGFYIRNEVNVQVFHRLFATTALRQGIKDVISAEQLQVLLDCCRDFTWGMTAYDSDDVPHASWIQMNAGNKVYNWNVASDAALLAKGGTPFIVVELLKKLRDEHVTFWDLCGADNPGVARFKASVGGVLSPYLKIDFSDYSFFDKVRFRLLQLG